ncbi:MAG TPA: DUF192 domain-containing protein [Candidatus Saccharimonadales bacterium]|jgi:uncharacterized membrane protein (UPF0127 family)|nr:DUF192 domain-containing protein [Candidatus Saccharimonadales bacterium]
MQPHLTLWVGDGVFNARVITPSEYANNSNQNATYLRQDNAVLRIYDRDGAWSVDMKDRHEQFDLVWLDGNKKVIHIVKNASAESAPSTVFRPLVDARYLIELQGGTVDEKTIRIDRAAHFEEGNIQGLKR